MNSTNVMKTINVMNTINVMKKTLLTLGVTLLAQSAWAGCESIIMSGSHTALDQKEAKVGAMHDARDLCQSTDITLLEMQCSKVSGNKGVQGKPAIQCRQEIVCNVCDEDLQRQYEAME